jgi:hypothetical protein
MGKTMLLSELSLITQDRTYFKTSCSYFDIAAEIVLLKSILQQFTSSSWITCGEGKDKVERSARSGASTKRTVGGVGEAVEVDGVLRGQRQRCALGEAVKAEGEAIERRRGRSGRGDDVLRG